MSMFPGLAVSSSDFSNDGDCNNLNGVAEYLNLYTYRGGEEGKVSVGNSSRQGSRGGCG